MAKFRRKPVVIEAEQYFPNNHVRGLCKSPTCFLSDRDHVHTIHNNQPVKVEAGDFIIPEPDGEHYYPCKPDIFDATYEPL